MSKDRKVTLTFPFQKENYYLLIAGVVLAILGFMLMSGGASDDPNVYNPEVFSFRRITLGPIFVIGGYVVVLLAILRKSKGESSKTVSENSDTEV